MNSNHLSCSSWIVAQEMVGIVAGGVLSGYVHTFAFFFFLSAIEAERRAELLWHLGK